MTTTTIIDSLHRQIAAFEAQLADLRRQLAEAEHQRYQQLEQERIRHRSAATAPDDPLDHDMNYGIADAFRSEICAAISVLEEQEKPVPPQTWPLEKNEYRRYGRQLIMPEVGLQGQLRLKNASVLVVGVGGLGCPAAAYLAGAGVGRIGLVDEDVVEESNLHRQILHSTSRVGMTKVDSAMVMLSSLNPNVQLVPHYTRLTSETALPIFQHYDLVLDCTDTPASRYLISDTCVLLSKPLVSASALRTDGQLMVLNHPARAPGDPSGGPCYRCVFPKPPPPESVTSCGDGGILGPVVGVMGVLQALEAIKLLTAPPSKKPGDLPTLLIFSAYGTPQFRTIRLRGRKPRCAACSASASITKEALISGSLDYVQFCGSVAPVNALSPSERISVDNFAKLRTEVNPFTGNVPRKDGLILLDVREKVQFELGALEGSVNIPYSMISAAPSTAASTPTNSAFTPPEDPDIGDKSAKSEPDWISALRNTPEKPIFVVCRLGNDSQLTVRKLKELGLDFAGQRYIGDIKGGLRAWREKVDPEFPDY